MKLYAKTTSERASKGQGGNREVVIDLTIDPISRKEIGRVVMRAEDYSKGLTRYTVYYYPITATTGKGGRTLLHQEDIETTKGEKKKSEKCQWCEGDGCFHCDHTGKQ